MQQGNSGKIPFCSPDGCHIQYTVNLSCFRKSLPATTKRHRRADIVVLAGIHSRFGTVVSEISKTKFVGISFSHATFLDHCTVRYLITKIAVQTLRSLWIVWRLHTNTDDDKNEDYGWLWFPLRNSFWDICHQVLFLWSSNILKDKCGVRVRLACRQAVISRWLYTHILVVRPRCPRGAPCQLSHHREWEISSNGINFTWQFIAKPTRSTLAVKRKRVKELYQRIWFFFQKLRIFRV